LDARAFPATFSGGNWLQKQQRSSMMRSRLTGRELPVLQPGSAAGLAENRLAPTGYNGTAPISV
ncbi:MAG: hypothetical protein RL120_06490, partial [Gammaproteobacteria bacterium]